MSKKQWNGEPSNWLLEEYKLLSAHYFHEDNLLYKSISIFGALNSGLLAFYGSSFLSDSLAVKISIYFIGIGLSFSWFVCLIRIRTFRRIHEARIHTIEEKLRASWPELGVIAPPDIRITVTTNTNRAVKRLPPVWVRPLDHLSLIPSSYALRVVPISFFCIWIILPIWEFILK